MCNSITQHSFALDLLMLDTPCGRCARSIPADTLCAVDPSFAATSSGDVAPAAVCCLVCAGEVLRRLADTPATEVEYELAGEAAPPHQLPPALCAAIDKAFAFPQAVST